MINTKVKIRPSAHRSSEEGTIDGINTSIHVAFADGDGWFYSPEQLELIEQSNIDELCQKLLDALEDKKHKVCITLSDRIIMQCAIDTVKALQEKYK